MPPTVTPSPVSDASDNSRWFAEAVHAHESTLKAYLRNRFPQVRDVEDVVQESYLRVWRRQIARPIESARAFLFKVARHLALDTLRHERASPFEAVTDLDASSVQEYGPTTAEDVCQRQELALVLEAIESLPARCREIVILRKLKGVPQKEIARLLGISEQTVQVQACRGLRRCGEYLRKHGVNREGRS